jgi:hypothetical protein
MAILTGKNRNKRGQTPLNFPLCLLLFDFNLPE